MAVAYLQSGQQFEMNDVVYELDRLIGNEWQHVEVKTKRAGHIAVDNLSQKYATGGIKFLGVQSHYIPKTINHNLYGRVEASFDFYPETLKEQLKIRRVFIEKILKMYGDIRSQSRLREPISVCWDKAWGKLPSTSTVAKWIKRYIETDKDIRSLGSCHFLKGNRQERYPIEVTEICWEAIHRIYLQLTRGSVKKTLLQAKEFINKENQRRPEGYHLPYPKESYIRELIKTIAEYEKYARRYGKNAADHKFRNAVHTIICDKPLQRIEIDHTQLDLLVVDPITGVPLGRPWLTVALDVHSRAFLGFQLSFDPPSHMTVARVLKMALLPKNIKSRWPEVKGKWPMFGLMQDLVVDNGYEFHSNSLESACLELGINIAFCPRKKSWWKGHVERVIGTINRAVTDGVKGRTFSSITEKGDYNPSKHAAITLKTIEQVIAIWIVDIYHESHHSKLGMKPREAWEKGIRIEDIPLITDVDKLDFVVGVVETRSIQPHGIQLNSLYYNSDEIKIIIDQFGNKEKCTIKWNPEDLGSIQLYAPDGRTIIIPAKEDCQLYAPGLTYYRHLANQAYAVKYLKRSKDDIEALMIAHAQIQVLVEQDLHSKGYKTHKMAARLNSIPLPLLETKPKKIDRELVATIPKIDQKEKRPKFEATVSNRKQNKGY